MPVPGMQVRRLTAHAAVSAAHACDAARAVAAAYQAFTRARRMGALVLRNGVAGSLRIVRTVAAGVEMDLGLGGAHGAEQQGDGDK
jgi:hypothetical protein